MYLNKAFGRGWDWTDLAQDRDYVLGSCERDNEHSSSINVQNFLSSWRTKLLKKIVELVSYKVNPLIIYRIYVNSSMWTSVR